MGIMSRFATVIRSNMNAMLNRAEDPTKILEQTILDMDTAYAKAKDQVARSALAMALAAGTLDPGLDFRQACSAVLKSGRDSIKEAGALLNS